MRTRPAKIGFTIVLVILVGFLTEACSHYRASAPGSLLDIRLTEADSPEEIENMICASPTKKHSSTNTTRGYTTYHVTNGPARWLFVKVANAPRGLAMFNLYCYEWKRPDSWRLCGYVPVNWHDYTNSDDLELTTQIDNDYVNVCFRGKVIFTTTSRKEPANGVPNKR